MRNVTTKHADRDAVLEGSGVLLREGNEKFKYRVPNRKTMKSDREPVRLDNEGNGVYRVGTEVLYFSGNSEGKVLRYAADKSWKTVRAATKDFEYEVPGKDDRMSDTKHKRINKDGVGVYGNGTKLLYISGQHEGMVKHLVNDNWVTDYDPKPPQTEPEVEEPEVEEPEAEETEAEETEAEEGTEEEEGTGGYTPSTLTLGQIAKSGGWLGWGHSGAGVEELQDKLIAAYGSNAVGPTKADSKFGPNTAAAVGRLQKDLGFTDRSVDSIYGPKTHAAWAAIGFAVPAAQQQGDGDDGDDGDDGSTPQQPAQGAQGAQDKLQAEL